MGEKRFLQELHRISAGLFAGGNGRPNALAPLTPLFATRALRDFPVENHESNCLLGQIVGRVDAWCGDEFKERGTVFAKTRCHVLRLA